jgi:hypothetical protein
LAGFDDKTRDSILTLIQLPDFNSPVEASGRMMLARRRRVAMMWVHAGFVKTATSTLQQAVFARHDEINYLGLPAPSADLDRAIHALAKADSIEFDLDRARSALTPHLRPPAPRRTTVVSYENFVLYESADKGVVARRLRDVFPDCQILFTIRRQQDIIRSWYLQKLAKYLDGLNYLPFDKWFAMKMVEPHKSILGDLDFNRTIGYYESLFGSERVKIFCYEQLIDDPTGYARAMAECLKVDDVQFSRLLSCANYNPTKTQRRIDLGRIATDYLPRAVVRAGARLISESIKARCNRFLNRGPTCRVALSPAAEQWIAAHCRQGNRELDARYGGQLARYGYMM